MECQSLWTDGENKKFQNLISNDRELRGKKLSLHFAKLALGDGYFALFILLDYDHFDFQIKAFLQGSKHVITNAFGVEVPKAAKNLTRGLKKSFQRKRKSVPKR